MRQHIAFLYSANLDFTRMLVGDIHPEQMTEQPHGVINHPAWSLGNLVFTADSLGQMLGLDATLPGS